MVVEYSISIVAMLLFAVLFVVFRGKPNNEKRVSGVRGREKINTISSRWCIRKEGDRRDSQGGWGEP